MAILNITSISKILENNPVSRKVFNFAVRSVLYVLEQQRLIDYRQLEKASLDWNRGTLNLGDGFFERILGRAIGEYVIDKKKKKLDMIMRAKVNKELNKGEGLHNR